MGSPFSMANLARAAKIAALLLFLLPWVTVSCSPQALGRADGPPGLMAGTGDMVLVKATGLQFATGKVTATNPNPSSASAPPNPFTTPNYPILGGALLILLSLAASFVPGRRGSLAAAAGCALAAILLGYGVLVQIPAEVHASFAGSAGAGSAAPPAELGRMIQVKGEIGFWLTLMALAAATVVDLLALRTPRRIAPARGA